MARVNTRANLWHFKEECDRLHWKFKNGRLTREEMEKFCSVFAITNLLGWGGGGLPVLSVVTTTNTTGFNLFSAAGSPAFPVDVRHTINSGIYVYSLSIATPGYDLGAGWAAGSKGTLTNLGFVLGKGGKGATDAGGGITGPESGGPAMKLQSGLTFSIDNNGQYIAGGGGGGGGLSLFIDVAYGSASTGGGGGAGGGDGGNSNFPYDSGGGFGAGGAGGGPGSNGGAGSVGASSSEGGGGGGGRVLPGTGGAGATCSGINVGSGGGGGGAGGGGGEQVGISGCSGSGSGTGGASNGAGSNGTGLSGGGGGGWGAAGGSAGSTGGGAGGKAIDLNGQASPTFINTGNVYGAVS
jgi:hypothetical protein